MLKKYFAEEKYEEIKNNQNLIYKSLEIVTNIFKNDLDKGGHPYILHLLYVYSNVHNEKEKVIALLHDIIEDKDVSDTDLLEVGYPEDIVMSVKLLSKSHGADYNKYIDNIINNGNVDTLNVKLADLKHNMDISRIKDPTISDYERIQKRYAPSYEKILNKLNEMEK